MDVIEMKVEGIRQVLNDNVSHSYFPSFKLYFNAAVADMVDIWDLY